eukprot:2537657-Karenia_brevis.AAC.1
MCPWLCMEHLGPLGVRLGLPGSAGAVKEFAVWSPRGIEPSYSPPATCQRPGTRPQVTGHQPPSMDVFIFANGQ